MFLPIIRDIVGLVVSAGITGTLFLWPIPVAAIVYLFPSQLLDTITTTEPAPVYYDGAWEKSLVEEDGEIDGNLDKEPPPTPSLPEPAEEEPDPPAAAPSPSPPTPNPQPSVRPSSGPRGGSGPKPDSLAVGAGDGPSGSGGTGTGSGEGTGAGDGDGGGGEAAKGTKRNRSRRECPRSYEGIRLRSDGVYQIDQALVDYHTSNKSRFNQLGYSRNNKDGKGWYIGGFGCNGALWHGGLRRGDVVLAVNGKKTNNLVQLLAMYTKFRNQKNFEVILLRKQRSVTLRYEIR